MGKNIIWVAHPDWDCPGCRVCRKKDCLPRRGVKMGKNTIGVAFKSVLGVESTRYRWKDQKAHAPFLAQRYTAFTLCPFASPRSCIGWYTFFRFSDVGPVASLGPPGAFTAPLRLIQPSVDHTTGTRSICTVEVVSHTTGTRSVCSVEVVNHTTGTRLVCSAHTPGTRLICTADVVRERLGGPEVWKLKSADGCPPSQLHRLYATRYSDKVSKVGGVEKSYWRERGHARWSQVSSWKFWNSLKLASVPSRDQM